MQEMARLLERHARGKCARDSRAVIGLGCPGIARLVCAHDAGDAVVAEAPVLRLRQGGLRPAEWSFSQTALPQLDKAECQACSKIQIPGKSIAADRHRWL